MLNNEWPSIELQDRMLQKARYRLLSDYPHYAEEVFDQAVDLWRSLPEHRRTEKALWVKFSYQCKSQRRTLRRHERILRSNVSALLNPPSEGVEETVERSETCVEIRTTVQILADQDQRVAEVATLIANGRSIAEISRLTGLNRYSITQMLGQLRQAYETGAVSNMKAGAQA